LLFVDVIDAWPERLNLKELKWPAETRIKMETGFGNDPQRCRLGTKLTIRRRKTVGYYGIVVLLSVQFV
jgi:hypothetical protein